MQEWGRKTKKRKQCKQKQSKANEQIHESENRMKLQWSYIQFPLELNREARYSPYIKQVEGLVPVFWMVYLDGAVGQGLV